MSNIGAGAPLPTDTSNMNAFIAAQMQMYQQAIMQYSMMQWQPQSSPQPQLQPPALQVLIPRFAYIPNYSQCYSPSQISQQTPSPSLSSFGQSSTGSTSPDSPRNAATPEAATDPNLAGLERPGKGHAKKGKGNKKAKPSDDVEKRTKVKVLEVIDVDETEDSDGAEAQDDAECKEADASGTERLRVMPSVPVPRHIQELRLIEELREKAMGLKKRLLRRFKMESLKKSNRTSKKHVVGRTSSRPSSKLDKEWKCSYPNCTSIANRRGNLVQHIATHYPDAYFCPVCHSTFSRVDVLDRHLEQGLGARAKAKQRRGHKGMLFRSRDSTVAEKSDETFDLGIPCVESEEALRFEVGRDKERFNVYYLGVMEDYEMSEEHFEMLAGRRRGELDWADE